MDLGAISARSGAPNDGAGKGEVQGFPNAYSRSKQNSDAAGMMYQWGQKEPRTFATSSLHNGGTGSPFGKYPVKIYNSKSELIYQEDGGRDNKGMTPLGGVIHSSVLAGSVIETIKRPNMYYITWSSIVSHVGHSKELFNYYWTSYSRGSDGGVNTTEWTNIPHWHNTYLDGYTVLRTKSIYDPCPYGYRTPTNGTYNDFANIGWIIGSYEGGSTSYNSWFTSFGRRDLVFVEASRWGLYYTSTVSLSNSGYLIGFVSSKTSGHKNWPERPISATNSLRCIEDATGKADQKKLTFTRISVLWQNTKLMLETLRKIRR